MFKKKTVKPKQKENNPAKASREELVKKALDLVKGIKDDDSFFVSVSSQGKTHTTASISIQHMIRVRAEVCEMIDAGISEIADSIFKKDGKKKGKKA